MTELTNDSPPLLPAPGIPAPTAGGMAECDREPPEVIDYRTPPARRKFVVVVQYRDAGPGAPMPYEPG